MGTSRWPETRFPAELALESPPAVSQAVQLKRERSSVSVSPMPSRRAVNRRAAPVGAVRPDSTVRGGSRHSLVCAEVVTLLLSVRVGTPRRRSRQRPPAQGCSRPGRQPQVGGAQLAPAARAGRPAAHRGRLPRGQRRAAPRAGRRAGEQGTLRAPGPPARGQRQGGLAWYQLGGEGRTPSSTWALRPARTSTHPSTASWSGSATT